MRKQEGKEEEITDNDADKKWEREREMKRELQRI